MKILNKYNKNGGYSKEYYRTKEGLVRMAYGNMRSHSKKVGSPIPNFTFQELLNWALAQENFNRLYDNWVISEYNTELKPSFDRLDSSKPYSLDNLQLLTFLENKRKGSSYRSYKNNPFGPEKLIYQFNLDGELITEHKGLAAAAKAGKVSKSAIANCVTGYPKLLAVLGGHTARV